MAEPIRNASDAVNCLLADSFYPQFSTNERELDRVLLVVKDQGLEDAFSKELYDRLTGIRSSGNILERQQAEQIFSNRGSAQVVGPSKVVENFISSELSGKEAEHSLQKWRTGTEDFSGASTYLGALGYIWEGVTDTLDPSQWDIDGSDIPAVMAGLAAGIAISKVAGAIPYAGQALMISSTVAPILKDVYDISRATNDETRATELKELGETLALTVVTAGSAAAAGKVLKGHRDAKASLAAVRNQENAARIATEQDLVVIRSGLASMGSPREVEGVAGIMRVLEANPSRYSALNKNEQQEIYRLLMNWVGNRSVTEKIFPGMHPDSLDRLAARLLRVWYPPGNPRNEYSSVLTRAFVPGGTNWERVSTPVLEAWAERIFLERPEGGEKLLRTLLTEMGKRRDVDPFVISRVFLHQWTGLYKEALLILVGLPVDRFSRTIVSGQKWTYEQPAGTFQSLSYYVFSDTHVMGNKKSAKALSDAIRSVLRTHPLSYFHPIMAIVIRIVGRCDDVRLHIQNH